MAKQKFEVSFNDGSSIVVEGNKYSISEGELIIDDKFVAASGIWQYILKLEEEPGSGETT